MPAISATAVQSDGISPRNFKKLAAFIYGQSGIRMPETKLTMVEGRLRRRVRALGMASLDAYCEHVLGAGVSDDELVHLINAVTTNKTDFFREPRHFDYLRQTILPQWRQEGRRRLRVWSAACSTGAEPYTIAMVLDDFSQQNGGLDYQILATDLDTEVLSTAIKGIYPAELLAPVPPDMHRRYVMRPRSAQRRDVRISPALRSKVAFGRLNLMDDNYPIGDPVDIVFCRNVLIYFDKPTQQKVVNRLCAKLRPGGYLMLGHSESIAGMNLPVKAVANTVFRRN